MKRCYLLWKPASQDVAAFRDTLLGAAPALVAAGARTLAANFADVEASVDATVPVRGEGDALSSLVTLTLSDERGDDAGAAIERVLASCSSRLAGYAVTESIPRDYDARTWPDGERTPGVKLLTLFSKPPGMAYADFIHQWHESHTPLSLEIHPMWCYIRNVVDARLTEGADDYQGIVEEQFRTLEDLTDPDRFYGSQENMRRVLDDARRFLDLEKIKTYVMSEYILRSRER